MNQLKCTLVFLFFAKKQSDIIKIQIEGKRKTQQEKKERKESMKHAKRKTNHELLKSTQTYVLTSP